MSFFDRRKSKDRRSGENSKKGEISANKKLTERSGKDRRTGNDRRSDKYHQLKSDRRKVIDQIIDLLEKSLDH